MHLQAGDEFMRISKYGSAVFGVVKDVYQKIYLGADCDYYRIFIRSTNGVEYEYNECYKIKTRLTPEETERRLKFEKRVKNRNKFTDPPLYQQWRDAHEDDIVI